MYVLIYGGLGLYGCLDPGVLSQCSPNNASITLQYTDRSHHWHTKAQKSIENPRPAGNIGGSSCNTLDNTSKSVLQFL